MDDYKTTLNFNDIGAKIRLERERLDLTREKLAEIIGLSSFYIGQIERGDRKMSIDTLAKIANTLHISVDYLLNDSNIYNQELEIKEYISVSENPDKSYNPMLDDDLNELFCILIRCSKEEISLIKDITKLIIPHLAK